MKLLILKKNSTKMKERGVVLVTTLFMMVVLLALLGAFYTITNVELATQRYTKKSSSGFYTAEAGLNIRAENIRNIFVGYNRPTGTSPTSTTPCSGSDNGSGDFACQSFTFGNRHAQSYVLEDATNPIVTTIPPGELYQGLNAQEYRYTVHSTGLDAQNNTEAILELKFKSRLVPLFQFLAFYDKDLEILPGPAMTLTGPVHANRDLYLDAGATLSFDGQLTTAGSLYRGRKDNATCLSTPVSIKDPNTFVNLVPACPSRHLVTAAEITPYHGMINMGVSALTVPPSSSLDPIGGSVYWDNADLRLALHVDASANPVTTYAPTGIEVRRVDNSVDTAATTYLAACSGGFGLSPGKAVQTSFAFRNNRENKAIRMLDIDMRALMNCIHANYLAGGTLMGGKTLNDTTQGGLVFHLSVAGPNSTTLPNNYGVRLGNGATLQASVAGYPTVKGITVVTDQALYVQGDYNLNSWIPAALMGDSLNPLSNAWWTPQSAGVAGAFPDSRSTLALGSRVPSNTSLYAAIMAGTDTTGGVEGVGGQNGAYNGGLENYPRFHEDWSNGSRIFTYRGSFVSLIKPRRYNGAWVYGTPQYTAPVRNWDYDTRFNNAANLPPLTPRFVYLRQELFVRDWDK
jgi:hypothetical protein